MAMLSSMRLRAAALLVGLALALSGCFVSPGKFTAELVLTGPDSFTFHYEGEIFFLGLSKLAQMGAEAEEKFTPSECYKDGSDETRPCTRNEIEAQRTEWEAGAAERAARAKQEAQQMAAIMGGIDPTDPKAADELVALLQRQKGWERVVNKGDGVFEVSYRVSGSMSHDFMFPTIEGFPATNPFVQVIQRKGGQLRINAPGFATQTGDQAGGPMGALFGLGSLGTLAAMGAGDAQQSGESEALKNVPKIEGTFAIRAASGMRILANNTDEGPRAEADGGEALIWRITPRTAQPPTALIATTP